MKQLLYLTIIFTVFTSIGFSQDDNNVFDFEAEVIKSIHIPNTPEAQAFTKYGNTSVNLFKGIPNINIPIYTIKGNEIDIPINLSYDASGIKVEQQSTWVGLGWNLNVGGMISRITQGFPDDGIIGGSTSYFNDYTRQEILTKGIEFPTYFATLNDISDYYSFLKDCSEFKIEAQPDLFSFNALGINDYFIIDINTTNLEAKALNNPNIKVDYNYNDPNIDSWTVTNDDGTIFYFNVFEKTEIIGDDDVARPGRHRQYHTSWLLTRIESTNKKDIFEFNYALTDFAQQPFPVKKTHASNPPVSNEREYVSDPINIVSTSTGNIFYPNVKKDNQYLTEIIHNGKKIISFELEMRDDDNYTSNSGLNKMIVWQDEFSKLQTIDFIHSYFESDTDSPIGKRYKLNEVHIQEKGETPNTIKKYMFEYDDNDDNFLPEKDSKSQDYLGFYNGEPNNVLYPELITHKGTLSETKYTGANREPNFNFAKKGTLNKITYPTGGYTMFEYEPHDTYIEEEISDFHIYSNLSVSSSGAGINTIISCFNDQNKEPVVNEQMFEIEEAGTYLIDFHTNFDSGNSEAFLIERDNLDDEFIPLNEIVYGACENNALWHQTTASLNHEEIELTEGIYQITILIPKSGVGESGGVLYFNLYRREIEEISENQQKAGMRIKSVTDYEKNNVITNKKEYIYKDAINSTEGQLNKSTGIIINEPKLSYYTKHKSQYPYGNGTGQSCQLYIKSALNRTNDSNIDNYLIYRKVFEKSINNGYTEHIFDFCNGTNCDVILSGFINNQNAFPNQIVQYKNIYGFSEVKEINTFSKNNELLNKIKYKYPATNIFNTNVYGGIAISNISINNLSGLIFDTSGGGYQAISGAGGFRIFDHVESGIGGLCGLTTPIECGTIENPNPDVHCWQGYTNNFATYQMNQLSHEGTPKGLIQIKKSNYFNNNIVEEIKNINYHESNNVRVKQTENIVNNISMLTKYKYADDLLGQSLMSNLVENNRLTEPIQTKTYKKEGAVETLLSTQKTIYDEFGSNNLLLPNIIQTSKGENDNDLETRIIYHNYDNYGNPTEISKANGKSIFYIWGYNHTQPIAKIEGIPLNLLPTSATQPFETLDFSNEQTVINALNILRNLSALNDAMITTFTYKPLIGVSTITDPKGDTQYYIYDDFNRLQYVKDQEGNILKENQYRYRD